MPLPESALVDAAEAAVRQASNLQPEVGIVLGSGLGDFADQIQNATRLPYAQIPNMPGAGVAGHAGVLHLGEVSGRRVACLQGRAHAYEGYPEASVVFGVCLLAWLGCSSVILTNAAGGIAPSLRPGALMLISDHLNLTGRSPLIGPLTVGSERFIDMTHAYDRDLCAAARRAAATQNLNLDEGVYAGLLGPSYETPAEIRMLGVLGASAVGMSTVLEVLALRQLGVRVAAVSCITNLAAGISPTPLTHDEVQQTAAAARGRFIELLTGWLAELDP